METMSAIDEFVWSRDLAAGTRQWYRLTLGAFADCVTEVEAITPTALRAYMAHLQDRPAQRGPHLASATVYGHARALRVFLHWLASEGLVEEKMASRVVMPRREAKVTPALSHEHVERLFNAAHTARDKAILAVLLDTGVRAAELCSLTSDRVYLSQEDAYLLVRGKGLKQREVGLGRRARSLLARHLRGVSSGAVFRGRGGAALTPGGLDHLLYRLRDRAGLRGVRVGAHQWRHTYAYRYIEAGGDLFKLARLMGHSSVVVTQAYLTAFDSREARRGLSVLDGPAH
jgi:integrase/recombinase XerD